MAADLRFCLAEPLQLVARRNEKSSAELSRFLAKQVSGRRGARRQPPGGHGRGYQGGKGMQRAAFPLRAAISSQQLCLPPRPRAAGGGGGAALREQLSLFL